jgi:hypothetical protein
MQPSRWPLLVAAVFMTAGAVLLLVAARGIRATGRPLRPGEIESWLRVTALGILCVLLGPVVLFGAAQWQLGVALLGLIGLWILAWTPRSQRTLEVMSEIDVRCEPQAAFALVSDPHNWHLYAPQLQVVEPIPTPMQVGSIIHDRVRTATGILEAGERVIAMEPGRRFGTAVVGSPQGSSGTYDFEPAPGGTKVRYTHRSVLTMSQAALGMGLRRRSIATKMAQLRGDALERIKRILEGGAQPPL